jgi:hypothetical protein
MPALCNTMFYPRWAECLGWKGHSLQGPCTPRINRKNVARPGLPDGLFSDQKSLLGYILEGLRLQNVDIFYCHLEFFTDIWVILLPFITFCVHLVHFVFIWYIFTGFGIMYLPRKIWQPWRGLARHKLTVGVHGPLGKTQERVAKSRTILQLHF